MFAAMGVNMETAHFFKQVRTYLIRLAATPIADLCVRLVWRAIAS